MNHSYRVLRRSLITSSILLAAALAPTQFAAAFNPDAGADTAVRAPSQAAAAPNLPDPRAIYGNTSSGNINPAPTGSVQMPAQPLYTDRVAQPQFPMPQPPAPVEAAAPAPVAQPLAAAPAGETVVDVPPVQSVSSSPSGVEAAPLPPPPAPMATGTVPAAEPVQQLSAPATGLTQPRSPELSNQTRQILSQIKGGIDATPPVTGSSKVSVNRVNPEIKNILGPKAKEESYEAVGLSIKVRRPGLDTNYELNRAYTSLMGGDTDAAIETYKNILSVDATNQDALFGLAATYHRLGNIEKARPLYGALLKLNPNHREALNNFLVLVGDESPQDALPELQRLEARNPAFSPIPAQMAILLDKLGFADEAREKMLRAIELAPDNLTYKYNLAIMLDQHGQVADAAALYRLLIESALHGQKVPATVEAMQKRLNYLTASANNMAAAPQPEPISTVN